MGNTMNPMDSVSGSLAECFITIDGERFKFMQLYEFESKYEVTIAEVPILGKTTKGHKPTGGSGTWSGTAHYNQSVLRKVLYRYKTTGLITPFDIQVTNEDPTSAVGRQTIIHKGCLIEGGTLAKYGADDEYLDEDLSGTFDDWEMPEEFSLLNGMR